MFNNPFSPIFGGRPGFFFGREEILFRFDLAMVEQGSEDRALFFTGTRGSGKTALLEQLSLRASKARRRVIDLGPEDTIAQMIQELAGADERTSTVSPQASVSVLGIGGGVSAGSISKTTRFGRESLQPLLIKACERAANGLLVTVDEIQKVPLDDVSSLCNAFQMASRKGHDVMLAVAGLPYAHDEIIQHEGCTYLRRASREELGLFSWDEANAAFASAFAQVKGLVVDDALVERLNEASYGQPYLMQLLGYHLVAHVNRTMPPATYAITTEDLEAAVPLAVLSYEQHALKPLLEGLSDTERKLLRAMSELLSDERLAAVADVAARLGKEQQSLSKARARLIGNGIIAAPERGKLMFCIPYLASYMAKAGGESSVIAEARRRRV